MSGGHFDYKQYEIEMIAEQIEQLIISNPDKEWYNYSEETIQEFKEALRLCRTAAVYVQRIDWLVSGDDGEESFHSRLNEQLKKVNND